MDENKTQEGAPTAGDDKGKDSNLAKEPSQKIERSERDKAAFSLKKNAERLVELGGDPTEVLNIHGPNLVLDDDMPDDTPLTVGTFREYSKKEARKTALQMAQDLPDSERDDVVRELGSIVPSANPDEDLRKARAIANAPRNARIAQMANKPDARRTASGGSQGASTEDPFTPTPEEAMVMGPPYKVSKEKILALRKKQAETAQ
jgi:hypothetical protein